MLVFFFPFFENLGSDVYDSMRARVRFCFWKASAQRFFRWEVVRHARACSRKCMLARRARGVARDGLAALGVLGGSAAKWTNVVWPIKRRQTNRQTDKLTKVGSDQRSSTIQYNSKSAHSMRRQTVNWTWEVACWFSFSLFLKISAVTYTTACARAYGFVFERHQRSDFLVEKLYGMRALALGAVHALARRARGAVRTGLAALGVLGGSAANWTNVVWPIKSRQTNRQTDKHTLLFYRYRLADHAEPCSATVPSQHWAAEKQTWKLSPSFSPLPTHVTSARKQPSSPDIMVGRAACACALHPFLLCLEHDNGSVRWHTLLTPTNTSK